MGIVVLSDRAIKGYENAAQVSPQLLDEETIEYIKTHHSNGGLTLVVVKEMEQAARVKFPNAQEIIVADLWKDKSKVIDQSSPKTKGGDSFKTFQTDVVAEDTKVVVDKKVKVKGAKK